MSDSAHVEVHGYAELAAGSAILARRIDEGADEAFALVAGRVAQTVRGSVPRRTGALASSVGVLRSGDAVGVQMGAGIRYAPFVEHGGRGHTHSAQGRYLYPAAMAAEPLLVAAGQAAAAKEIGAMRWPSPR